MTSGGSARPVVAVLALVGLGFAVHYGSRPPRPAAADAAATGLMAEPIAVPPFAAMDLDGVDRSPSTWAGRTVIVNFWATWCPPCRREIPALADIQAAHPDTVLVLGILQDDVGDDFVRAYGRSVGLTFPVVRSTFDVERHFPPVLALPMTFIVDARGRLAAMYAGEIDPVVVGRDLQHVMGGDGLK
jgi:thiol-disulfide isomerase/thioredoxin